MKKKTINELRLNKNVISKFSARTIKGGGTDTYTCANSPMTSCNGLCTPPGPGDTSAQTGCVESVNIC